MAMRRREFIGALAAGALLPRSTARALQPPASQAGQGPARFDVDALYDRAIVIDALSVPHRLDAAEFAAIERTGYTGIHTSLANRNFQVAERALGQWATQFTQHGERFIHAVKAADFERAKREKKLAVLLGFQNGTILDSSIRESRQALCAGHVLHPAHLQRTQSTRRRLHGTHQRRSVGLRRRGGRTDGGARHPRRSLALRRADIRRRHRLQPSPAGLTHTMCRALHDHPRAKNDALIKAVSNKGGVTGMMALGYMVGPTADTSLEDYLRHIDHAVKVAGIDHVGLATDFQIRGIEAVATRESWYVPRLRSFKPSYNVRWPPWIPELDAPERFRTVTHHLAKRGYKSGDIEKILGLNWMRCFRDNFSG